MLFLVAALALLGVAGARPSAHGPPIRRHVEDQEDADSYVIGGKNALPGAWPWQLSLQILYNSAWQHMCGAALLRATRGLSAAHCVYEWTAYAFRVVAGLHDRSNLSGTQISRLSGVRYRMHADFSPITNQNDIAIMLFDPITPDDYKVMFATLPANNNNNFAGTICVITGWGRTSHVPDSELPYILQQANIPIITPSECANRMSGNSDHVVTSQQICAFDNVHTACNGDSGGPINCPGPEGYVVAGVSSWGVNNTPSGLNCLATYPSVFTRTSAYLDWIASNLS